ncbi:Peroxiredoxin-1 [Thelohanellus kitauei]|uniref:thioredoxin-dependent peroxiredoxin n=1 Tax=Thelohanellus kitauei TaxID=669202 RepID=A0A0C2MJF1_THEKT|nr:Peroxiredoxin-1 [Thelohanellus kitauei]
MSCSCEETCDKSCEPCACEESQWSCHELFVGKKAPDFSAQALMPNGVFQKISLKDFTGKYLVLFFYPADFTFVCPTEIIAFSDSYQKFKDIGCEVVAASCDSEYSHLAWTQKPRASGGLGKLSIPILADKSHRISSKYGILIEDKGVSLRGLFIIDPKGILRQITVNDLPVGRSVEETLRLVQAFQYTDEHGEVCPINWKKGDKGLDVKKSEEYFAKTYK